MAIFLVAIGLIYAISLCCVVTLFARTLLRERSGSTEALGTVLELTPSMGEQSARNDVAAASAKTA